MDWSTLAWTAWILAFIAIEGVAIVRRREDETLSAHVWRWAAVKGPRNSARTWAGRGALLAGGIWLTGHLAFGWWTI